MKKSVFQQASHWFALAGAIFFAQNLSAQTRTESSPPPGLDDIIDRQIVSQKQVLAYPALREADISWERRIWRVIDVREKMNLPFVCPESPLFQNLANAAKSGELTVYDAENDRFQKPLVPEEVENLLSKIDTIITWNVETGEEEIKIVRNEINPEDVKRFRIKEAWFFDKNTSTMRVRILGIAPLISTTDSDGNFRYEKPLFWVHYPTARPVLAHQKAYVLGNNLASNTTWEDIFEMRFFASTIIKENNLYDRRLEDYLTGTDKLMAAERIQSEIFNFEHDLWQF